MDQQRTFFLIALAIVSYFLWDSWNGFQEAKQNAQLAEQQAAANPTATNSSADPATSLPTDSGLSDAPTAAGSTGDAPASPASPANDPTAAASPQVGSAGSAGSVRVTTDLMVVDIDLNTGGLNGLQLKQYPVSLDTPNDYTRLLSDGQSTALQASLEQTVYQQSDGKNANWQQAYTAPQSSYTLADDATAGQTLVVPITTQLASGLQVVREYQFTAGDYLIQMTTRLTNNTAQDTSGALGSRLVHNGVAAELDVPFMTTFTGFAVNARDEVGDTENEFDDVSFADLADGDTIKTSAVGGWAATVQHYFVTAVLPSQDLHQYDLRYDRANNRYLAYVWSPSIKVPAGATVENMRNFYIGPKIQDRLDDYSESLTKTVDYGILSILCKPLFWLMNFLYGFIGVWGLVIILITILVKAAFYKLTEAQFRSMAKMRLFAPRIKALKERYGDDRQKQQQEMMKLFKKEKINPLGGCLPILLQMPVFIALYWVLLESVELKYSEFLWLPDLTQADPYYILPVVFAVSMFLQQRLSAATATMDPMQAKIMSLLPLFLGVFFSFFPSGLVLYWCVNNILSMAQQWFINRKIEAEQAKRQMN